MERSENPDYMQKHKIRLILAFKPNNFFAKKSHTTTRTSTRADVELLVTIVE